MPEKIAKELTENMVLVRDYSYFGEGSEEKQASIDEKILSGVKTVTWEQYVKDNGPWKW